MPRDGQKNPVITDQKQNNILDWLWFPFFQFGSFLVTMFPVRFDFGHYFRKARFRFGSSLIFSVGEQKIFFDGTIQTSMKVPKA